jgi:hypothetical protein
VLTIYYDITEDVKDCTRMYREDDEDSEEEPEVSEACIEVCYKILSGNVDFVQKCFWHVVV